MILNHVCKYIAILYILGCCVLLVSGFGTKGPVTATMPGYSAPVSVAGSTSAPPIGSMTEQFGPKYSPLNPSLQEMDAERTIRRARRNRTCFTRQQVCGIVAYRNCTCFTHQQVCGILVDRNCTCITHQQVCVIVAYRNCTCLIPHQVCVIVAYRLADMYNCDLSSQEPNVTGVHKNHTCFLQARRHV